MSTSHCEYYRRSKTGYFCPIVPRAKKIAGVTLIEILVSLAILAILVAIFIPAFISYRIASEQTTTMTNMKKIGHAFHLFAMDNGNIMPHYRPWGSSASNNPNSKAFWYGYLDYYLNGRYKDLYDPTYVRLKGGTVPASTYGLAAGFPGPFWVVDGVEQPSRTMLIATVGINAPSSTSRIPSSEAHKNPSQMGYHHNGKAIVLYVDTSVRALTPEEVPPYEARTSGHPRYPEYKEFWGGHRGEGVDGPTKPK